MDGTFGLTVTRRRLPALVTVRGCYGAPSKCGPTAAELALQQLPQGHPNGYPIYRLEWQSVGSLQRRLRNCLFGQRAELYAFGSSDLVALELFLMQRARRMTIETPAVRP